MSCFNDQEKTDPMARRPQKVQQDETNCGNGTERQSLDDST